MIIFPWCSRRRDLVIWHYLTMGRRLGKVFLWCSAGEKYQNISHSPTVVNEWLPSFLKAFKKNSTDNPILPSFIGGKYPRHFECCLRECVLRSHTMYYINFFETQNKSLGNYAKMRAWPKFSSLWLYVFTLEGVSLTDSNIWNSLFNWHVLLGAPYSRSWFERTFEARVARQVLSSRIINYLFLRRDDLPASASTVAGFSGLCHPAQCLVALK